MGLKSIQGRAYTPVYFRVNEFRENNPDWSIHTKLITNNETEIVVAADIIDEKGNVRATGHARELVNDKSCVLNKHSGIENCETSAIGRALANLGIGTEQMFASQDEINVAKLKEMKDLFDKKETENKTLPTANEMLIFFNQSKHITQKMYESSREYYTSYVVNSRMWKATEDPSYLKLATSSHFNLLGLYYRSVEMQNSGSYTNKKMVLAQNGQADPDPF
jgi:hypothetical protein